ncbi:MAG: T9SS type A sorting domain-containing protein [Saprospiraceae bacterium]
MNKLLPTFLLGVFFLVEQKISAQDLNESSAPATYFNPTHPALQAWEDFFQENYFSKGIPTDSLGEGTGYLPYVREKRLFDLRANFQGDAGGEKRWEIFREIRSRTLTRGGALPSANWQNLGPNKMEGQGGRMISHAFDPENSQVIWAGSATGGLWLSENGGDTWQPMTDQIPSSGVGAVAVNPLNPNSLIIGTGEGYAWGGTIRPGLGVFKSTDRGLLWSQSDFAYHHTAGVSAFKIVWSYIDTNQVWLAATNGIWKSTDAGLTWTLKKGDGTNQNTAICNDFVQHAANPNLLLAAIESDGIWRSTDGGDNWSKLGGGLPVTDLNFINLDFCKSQPDIVYASISSGQSTGFGLRGLFRTDDFGSTWVKIENAPNALCSPQFPNGPCQGWYDNVVAVSPHDPAVIWLGGVTLWRSTDGGETWVERDRLTCPNCSEPPACRTYVDQHDFAFDPNNPQIVYAFNDGGVAKSMDGGECFEHKNEGLFTGQLYAIASGRSDPGTIIGGTQDHGLQGIKLSENTNLAWDRWGFLDGSDVEVHATNANILYGGWIDGRYFRTNGGVHTLASQITNGINLSENNGFYTAILRQHPTDPQVLLGATKQRLYKTANGGNFWNAVATMNEPKIFEFDQVNPDFAYCAAWSFDGTWSFWRSVNGGDTWAPTSNNPGWRVTDIKSSPLQSGLVYVSRNSSLPNSPHIYKSTDHGDTWTAIQGDLPDLSVNAIAVHHFLPGVLFAATDLGVFVTCDDGETWTEYNDNLPVSIALDIEFNPVDTTLRVGTLGRGAYWTKAWSGEPSANDEVARTPAFGFANISPNPASQDVRINYFLEKTADVRLEVVNVLGQKVATIFSGKQTAGEYESGWDGRTVSGLRAQTGVYFVRLSVGGEAIVQRLLWQ